MGDRARRFTDNTTEARFLRSLFESGTLNGNERPATVRLQYPVFSKFSVRAWREVPQIQEGFRKSSYFLKI